MTTDNAYSIFDYFLDGILVIDQDKNIIYLNEKASQLFGLSPKRVKGKPSFKHFIFGDNNLLCMEGGADGAEAPSMYREVEFSSSTGASGFVQIMIQPDIRETENKRWIVYFHDVTDERNLRTKYMTEAEQKKSATEMAFKDAMTGLPNFRSFCNTLQEQINLAISSRNSFGVVILDVDKFKVFNDTYGHQQGDEVLRYVGKTLRESVRASDFPARYGGEEFVIVIPNTTVEGIMIVCEKVRQNLQNTQVPYLAKPGEFLSVTASFGGVCVSADLLESTKITDQKVFIESADKNLYESKEGGRNRSTITQWKP